MLYSQPCNDQISPICLKKTKKKAAAFNSFNLIFLSLAVFILHCVQFIFLLWCFCCVLMK